MAPDLLSMIRREIDERLDELRPLLAEYEQLLGAVDALVATARDASDVVAKETAQPKRTGRKTQAGASRRGSAAGALKLASGSPVGPVGQTNRRSAKSIQGTDVRRPGTAKRSATKPKSERAARGAAREAILAALEHGSHTVGELVVVTAMSTPNINGNLRKLASEGAVVKTEREGKAAWARPEMLTSTA